MFQIMRQPLDFFPNVPDCYASQWVKCHCNNLTRVDSQQTLDLKRKVVLEDTKKYRVRREVGPPTIQCISCVLEHNMCRRQQSSDKTADITEPRSALLPVKALSEHS